MSTIREAIRKAGAVGVRTHKAAPGPPVGAPFAGLGRMGSLGRFGHDAGLNQEQYQHNCGYVYSIIRTIANRIIGQPVFHARRVQPGQAGKAGVGVRKEYLPDCLKSESGQLQNFTASPILSAFRDPNPIMVRYTLMFNTVASLELTGKAFWWMRWGPGRKPEIWPLPSHWVQPVHTPTLFSSWIVEPGGGADRFTLPASDVCYFYYPNPEDPLSAYAPLTAMAKTVMSDESVEEAQRRTFVNAMAPGLAFTIGQAAEDSPTGQPTSPVLTRTQRRALKSILKDEYKGVVNSGEPMLLDGFIKDVKPVFSTPKEMDYLNSGAATKNRLAQGWGVNPISMGEIEGANRASSAVADDHLLNNVVNPRISMMSEIMTCWLPAFFMGRRDEVVYIQPAASKDIDYELNRDTAMVDRGAKSLNEWRESHGMPPIEDGDRAHIQGDDGENSDGWSDVIVDDDRTRPGGTKRRGRWVPVRVKTRDRVGHDHDQNGRFTGSGGGYGGSSDSGSSPHGSVTDSDDAHAARAVALMAKIKEHGKKAVAVAKAVGSVAKELAVEISWHVMTKNLAEEIADTSWDYSKIINAKGTGDWLSTNLGVSGNFAASVASHVLSYGLTKLKQHIAKRRRQEGSDDGGKLFAELFVKEEGDDDADGRDDLKTKVDAVFKVVTKFAKAMGCPDDQLPTRADVKAFIEKRDKDKGDENESEEDDDADAEEKGYTLPADSISAGWGIKATARHFRDMVDAHRKDVADALTGVLHGLGAEAVAELRKYRGKNPAEAVAHAIDVDSWAARIKDAVESSLLAAAKSGAAGEWLVASPKKGVRADVKAGLPGRLMKALISLVNKLLDGRTWGSLARAIAKQTKTAVARAIKNDRDPGDAAAEVLTEPVSVGANAERAADVEAAAAVNGGRHAAFTALAAAGKVVARRWMTCRDARVRDEHRRAHGQIARGDAPFVVGGEECQYPGDPALSPKNRCRCRCVSVSIYG